MQLSEQERVRREALNQIRALGIDPFPADTFEVNFKSSDFTTADFNSRLIKEIQTIKSIDSAKAARLAEYLKQNKFRANVLLEDQDFMSEMGLSETVSFVDSANREPQLLADFIATAYSIHRWAIQSS